MPTANSPRLDALLAIADLLAPGSNNVRAEVATAFTAPTEYIRQYTKRLRERRITKPQDNLPWIALVDALAAEKKLSEIDVNTETDEVMAALDALASSRKLDWAWTKNRSDLDDLDTTEFLELAGQNLKERSGLVVAQLDIDSDAIPLVTVPATAVARLVELGKTAGYGDVDLFTGEDLAGATRARQARETERAERLAPPTNEWRGFTSARQTARRGAGPFRWGDERSTSTPASSDAPRGAPFVLRPRKRPLPRPSVSSQSGSQKGSERFAGTTTSRDFVRQRPKSRFLEGKTERQGAAESAIGKKR